MVYSVYIYIYDLRINDRGLRVVYTWDISCNYDLYTIYANRCTLTTARKQGAKKKTLSPAHKNRRKLRLDAVPSCGLVS